MDGNISEDPLFCNHRIGDLGLSIGTSPCLPENNGCASLIGALSLGCTCNCGVWGDVTGDGQINPMDVVYMVNFVYKQQDARIPPPNCPYAGGDVNCDTKVNPVDVVHFVNLVYKNQNAFCVPCF